eukprot:Platyproteum_vivax@DN6305_c0_g1_i3.p1
MVHEPVIEDIDNSKSQSAAVSVCLEGPNYAFQFREDDLQLVFCKYGTLLGVQARPGSSKGFVWYNEAAAAQKALETLDDTFLEAIGYKLKLELVDEAPPSPLAIEHLVVDTEAAPMDSPSSLWGYGGVTWYPLVMPVTIHNEDPSSNNSLQSVDSLDELQKEEKPLVRTLDGSSSSETPPSPCLAIEKKARPQSEVCLKPDMDPVCWPQIQPEKQARTRYYSEVGESTESDIQRLKISNTKFHTAACKHAPKSPPPRHHPEKRRNHLSVEDGSKNARKYTCRYTIGVENEKDFQVARRIIGAKGANMKDIVQQSGGAKLRLRGRGSGYLEGEGLLFTQ